MLLRRSAFVVSALSLALAAACGSRGPLDLGDETVIVVGPDGSSDLDAAAIDAAPPEDATTSMDAARPRDGGRDSSVIHLDSGIPVIDCATCVGTACGAQIFACFQNPACQMALQCVITQCTAGGTPDPACALNCAGGDPQVLLQIFQIFQCIINNCGQDCGSILGGGGGGGGGGRDGGRPPPTPDGGRIQASSDMACGVFGKFPQICSE